MDSFNFWIALCIILPFALAIVLSLLPDDQDTRFHDAIRWWDEGED